MSRYHCLGQGTMAVLLSVALECTACLAEGPAAPAAAGVPPGSPTTVDLAPVLQKWGLQTRRQGKRGTCSVFALTGAIEFAVASKEHRPICLSVEFLNWASNKATKTVEDGGFFSDLWKGYDAYGICPEEDMPYLDHFDPKLQPSTKALSGAKKIRALGLHLHWIKEWDPKKGLTSEQLTEVRRTLQKGWPVSGGFLWPKKEQWENGVLQMRRARPCAMATACCSSAIAMTPSNPEAACFSFAIPAETTAMA